jgi:hypothetical protein
MMTVSSSASELLVAELCHNQSISFNLDPAPHPFLQAMTSRRAFHLT